MSREKRERRRFTIRAVEARRRAGLTQDQAAALLGCSPDALQKYETDKLRIHDDTAARMSTMYRDPRLRRAYCEHECAVGALENRTAGNDRSADELMLDLLLADRDELPNIVRTLRKITADDVVDATEEAECARCLTYLDTLAENIENLKTYVEYVCAKGAA